MDIAAFRGQHWICDTGAVDLGEQPRGEGERGRFTRQGQGFEYAEWQKRTQVIFAIARPHMLDEAFLRCRAVGLSS